VLDFYQTFKSQLLRWGVPKDIKLFEDYFTTAVKDQPKARFLCWQIVIGNTSYLLAKVLLLPMKSIQKVDEEEIARKFGWVVQGIGKLSRASAITSRGCQRLQDLL